GAWSLVFGLWSLVGAGEVADRRIDRRRQKVVQQLAWARGISGIGCGGPAERRQGARQRRQLLSRSRRGARQPDRPQREAIALKTRQRLLAGQYLQRQQPRPAPCPHRGRKQPQWRPPPHGQRRELAP